MTRSRSSSKLNAFLQILIIALQLCWSHSGPSSHSVKYAILIDAGSSSTRLHVYQYSLEPAHCGYFPKILVPSKKQVVKPGLSTFKENLEGIAAYLEPLMTFAKTEIPEDMYQHTPIFLKATAGMRALTFDHAQKIMRHTVHFLSSTPFLFKEEHAEIMSGQEEGAFGWLAVNQLMQRFPPELIGIVTQDQIKSVGSPNLTIGVLEMGGASTQITFQVPPTGGQVPFAFAYSLSLCTTQINLYTHSYLYYGLEAAQDVFDKKVADALPKDATADHTTPATSTDMDCVLPDDVKEVTDSVGLKHIMVGKGQFDGCVSKVQEMLFSKQTACHYGSCSFNGVYQPAISPESHFLAFENFYYIREALELPDKVTLGQWLEAGRKVCQLKFSDLRAKFPESKYNDGKIHSLCFSASYIYSLLTFGWGFTDDHKLPFTNDVNHFPIDWSIGAAVYELSRFHHEPLDLAASSSSFLLGSFSLWAVVGLVLLAISVISIVHRNRQRRTSDGTLLTLPLGGIASSSTSSVMVTGQNSGTPSVGKRNGYRPVSSSEELKVSVEKHH